MNHCYDPKDYDPCKPPRPRPIQRIYCIGSTGPTGPTGPAGPATINVGTTTTGEPGTPATVTNSGTDQNVILDFVIPAGATGPVGATDACYYFFS